MDHDTLQILVKAFDPKDVLKNIGEIISFSQQIANPMQLKTVQCDWRITYVDGQGYLVPYINVVFE